LHGAPSVVDASLRPILFESTGLFLQGSVKVIALFHEQEA